MFSGFGLWRLCAALSIAMAVCGCSTMLDMAGVARAGHQQDGTYVVSTDEERLACRQIRERLDVLDTEMASLPEKAAKESQSTPRTVGAAFVRMFGQSGDGLQSMDRYNKATAESRALTDLYVRKRCL